MWAISPSLSSCMRCSFHTRCVVGLELRTVEVNQDILTGSAVAMERIILGGRDTISLRRASLKPLKIHILVLMKHRLRLARIH
jgi:hypothetical protein